MFRWFKLIGLWATLSGFAFANHWSAREQVLLTCTQVPFEDIQKIVVLSRNDTPYLILTQRYGEIQIPLNLSGLSLRESKIPLPPWENLQRTLEWHTSSWGINTCAVSQCELLPVNCH